MNLGGLKKTILARWKISQEETFTVVMHKSQNDS